MQQQQPQQQNENQQNSINTQNQQNNNLNILFLSDLTPSITEEDLQTFFKFYSEKIKHISVTFRTKKSASATVIFEDQKIAELAKRNLNMQKLKGKTVRIMWHIKEKEIFENSQANIYIKNISIYTSPRQVFEHFSQFGEIISCKIPENEAGDHLGYGYINYLTVESAKNAIESENGKKIWNNLLEVVPFKNSKTRNEVTLNVNASNFVSNAYTNNNTFNTNTNFDCNLYVHNLPANLTEENFMKIFQEKNLDVKEIKTLKVIKNPNATYAVLVFSDVNSAENFKGILNEIEIEGKTLRVESYKKKEEANNPEKIPNNNCNMIIKNIPYDADENDLITSFEKFGEIKSVKIERINLVTKINDEYVEKRTSQGFGYISFSNNEEALNAKENMDGKYLPKFEMWKRPLVIDHFVPKGQRRNFNRNHPNANFNPNQNPNFDSNNYQQAEFMQRQMPPVFDMQNLNKEIDNIDTNNYNFNNNANNMKYHANHYGNNNHQQQNFNMNMNVPQNTNNLGQKNIFNNNNNKNIHQYPQNMNNNFLPPQMMNMNMNNMNMNMNMNMNQYPQNPQNANRQNQNSKQNQNPNAFQQYPQNNNFNNPNMQNIPNNQYQNPNQQNNFQQKTEEKIESNDNFNIDINYLNSLEDEEQKKEYLGEIIFNKISNHPLSQKFEFDLNKIGKATGMLLAIEDTKYIISTLKTEESLGEYIKEANKELKGSAI